MAVTPFGGSSASGGRASMEAALAVDADAIRNSARFANRGRAISAHPAHHVLADAVWFGERP